jgi:hypothetical protein
MRHLIAATGSTQAAFRRDITYRYEHVGPATISMQHRSRSELLLWQAGCPDPGREDNGSFQSNRA